MQQETIPCIFCLEELPLHDNNKVVERACLCQYTCHSGCLNTWQNTEKNSCPICRKKDGDGATAPHLEQIESTIQHSLNQRQIAFIRKCELWCIMIICCVVIAGIIGIYYASK
jgi:hypothetical protein